MNAQTGLMLQLVLLIALVGVVCVLKALEIYRRLQYPLLPAQPPERVTSTATAVSLATVPGADRALLQPLDWRVGLTQMQALAPRDRYRIPLGWYASERPQLLFTTLVRGVNHIAITGQSDAGKDNLALWMLLSLALAHPPNELQLCLIDGKGLDLVGFAGKAHTWRIALEPAEIAPALQQLTRERQRRAGVLRAAQVSKWDRYTAGDLPLLVCYVSELSLLQDAAGERELERWLNSELASGRAFGIRYLIATQNLSNFGTRWRMQLGLYLAGFQPSQSQDGPNTGISSSEIRKAGAVPPSELPPPSQAAGVFTAVEGRQAVTVRATLIGDSERRQMFDQLPNASPRVEALPDSRSALPGHSEAVEDASGSASLGSSDVVEGGITGVLPGSSSSAIAVSDEDRQLILQARAELLAGGEETSRRAICRHAFNGVEGGTPYQKVKAVLDELDGQVPKSPVQEG